MLRRLSLQLFDLAVCTGCVLIVLAMIRVTPILAKLASDPH